MNPFKLFKAEKRQVCFCAFCRTPHRIYSLKGVGMSHFVVSLLLTLSFMWGYWGQWHLQAIPLLLISLFLCEVLLHFRWRLALICRQCGFDPLIYKKSPERAAMKVKIYLQNRKNNPRFLLAPPLHLPKKSSIENYLPSNSRS